MLGVHVGTTTADTPSQLDTDLKTQGGHEWRSVDISNYAEVEAATEPHTARAPVFSKFTAGKGIAGT